MKNDISELLNMIRQNEEQAIYWRTRGDDRLAQYHRAKADKLRKKARELGVNISLHGVKPGTASRRSGRKEEARTAEPRRNFSADKMIAGAFKGMQKATGKNYATDVLQHVTTPKECEQWIRVVKAMCTDDAGTLDKKGYCNALNSVRDSMLFTIDELNKAIEDARRSGSNKAVPGYRTLIEQYQTNAGIIEKEIKANGGKVN